MTAPKPEDLGFRVCRPTFILLQSECLETSLQNIERRILVPVHHQPAVWAGVDSSALFQDRIQDTPLAVGQIDAVFVGLAYTLNIVQAYVNSKFVRLWAKAAEATRFILVPTLGTLWVRVPGAVNALGFRA